MISIDNVTVGYGTSGFVTAVDGVSLTINDNEILGIAGESGSGKSTLMRAVYGDFSTGLRIKSGTVRGHFEDARTGQVIDAPSSDVEVISLIPCTVFSDSSIGFETSRIITSGEAPGYVVCAMMTG